MFNTLGGLNPLKRVKKIKPGHISPQNHKKNILDYILVRENEACLIVSALYFCFRDR